MMLQKIPTNHVFCDAPNARYTIFIGPPSVLFADEKRYTDIESIRVYKVFNNMTGILEQETSVYPNALAFCHSSNEATDEILSLIEKATKDKHNETILPPRLVS